MLGDFPLGEDDWEMILEECDTDNNGKIDCNEFINLLQC